MVIVNDRIAFKFTSHKTIKQCCKFGQVTGQQKLLSRPFQLALGFNIAPYGANILTSENLT